MNRLRVAWFLLFFVHANLAVGQDLPTFDVPGFESEMQTLQRLHALHHAGAFSDCTLWDGWLPHATLWASNIKRSQYRDSLLRRRIDDEGYVAMQQHRGMAHSDGWPFPAWQQSTGIGFHFSTQGEGWAIQNFRLSPATSLDGWEILGGGVPSFTAEEGVQIPILENEFLLTTPPFRCGTVVAPFARLDWGMSGNSNEASCTFEWMLEDADAWGIDRSIQVSLPESPALRYTNVPLYRHAGYAGLLNRYRIRIRGAAGSTLHLKSLITAIDTRHPITNALFVRACWDMVAWTKDREFLKASIPRMRTAIDFALREFQVERENHVVVPWVGHDGKSGLSKDSSGKKRLLPGVGVGNNYWDLLPFGAHDAIATMYLQDALLRMADIEDAVARHTDWEMPAPSLSGERLREIAMAMKRDFQTRFWDGSKGRFVGWVDRDNNAVDYGFTFVNLEAIHYDLASPEQAKRVLDWISGQRIIDGDTSQGDDIYRWRFAPRATTKRNVETYVWVWSNPESIPWGDQVQDGGAVLGFSYFDLMARLKTNGPDDAWARLQAILSWFREVESEGGYRAYYAKPGRGTLQGGGPPGGLGMDQEFMESVLVPQVMLYGFLGFTPTVDGVRIEPKLPTGWPSLTIRGIRIGDEVIDVTAYADGTSNVTNHR